MMQFGQKLQHSPETGPSLYQQVRRTAEFNPRRIACRSAEAQLSYSELLQAVDEMAAGLHAKGRISIGEPAALIADNSIEWLVSSLAIQCLGAIEVPLDPKLESAELVSLLEFTECVAVITDSETLVTVLAENQQRLPKLRAIAWIGTQPSAATAPELSTLAQLRDSGRLQLQKQPGLLGQDRKVDSNTAAAIIRTSGTTGKPKAVLLSQGNLSHSMAQLPQIFGLGVRDDILLCLPLWHLYGRLIAYLSLGCGATLHLGDIHRLVDDLRRVRPTFLPAFPIIWEHIYREFADALESLGPLTKILQFGLAGSRHYYRCLDRLRGEQVLLRGNRVLAAFRNLPDLLKVALGLVPHALNLLVCKLLLHRRLGGRLRAAIVGDAPLPLSVDEGLRAMGFHIFEGYGSTEQTVSVMRTPYHNTPGTLGRPLPEVDLRILDHARKQVSPGEIGEIAVAGPQVCLGYYRDPQRDAAAFFERDGQRFHLTGDLGRIDLHGNLLFVGRTANVIWPESNRPVYPEWTEGVVLNSRYLEWAVLYPFGNSGLGILLVPDFRQLCRRLGPPPGLDREQLPQSRAPETWMAFVQQHESLFAAWLADEALLKLYRSELVDALMQSELPTYEFPARFRILPRPLRIGEELTPTLKLRRTVIHSRLETWGREHYISDPAPPQAQPHDSGSRPS